MKITILCVGKIKEKFYTAAIAEYVKRLSRYCKLEIVEVADEKTKDRASLAEEAMIKQREGDKLKRYLDGKEAYRIALAIDGAMLDSVELSEEMNRLMVRGCSHIIFVIGGSLGIADDVLSMMDYRLSFSKMTFPHQLMRVVLLEQVYRSYRIMNHEPYHK